MYYDISLAMYVWCVHTEKEKLHMAFCSFCVQTSRNLLQEQVALHWKANLQVVHACSLLVEMVDMDGDNTHRI